MALKQNITKQNKTRKGSINVSMSEDILLILMLTSKKIIMYQKIYIINRIYILEKMIQTTIYNAYLNADMYQYC